MKEHIDSIFIPSIGHWLYGKKPKQIARFCTDTRSLCPGDCYVALTDLRDGHIFLGDARTNGASCTIVSHPKPDIDLPQFVCDDPNVAMIEMAKRARSMFRGTMIAITGSFGKTTTKDILKLLLAVEKNVTLENKNGQRGVPMTLATITNGEAFAVIEVGIDAICTMDKLAELVVPNVAILTGIGKIHMSGMGNESTIAREKSKLLRGAIKNNGHGIFPEECLRFSACRKIQDHCMVIRENGEDMGYRMAMKGDQWHVTIMFGKKDLTFAMPHLMSQGIVKNFVLACICALECGIDAASIQKRINLWKPSKWRGEIMATPTRTYFVDCYNANSIAFANSVAQFDRLFPHGNRLFVIGALIRYEVGNGVIGDNTALFKSLPLRENDGVIIIGEPTNFSMDIINCNWKVFPSASQAMEAVTDFHGVVYLKGHRTYGLESLIC
ncbi:MAG: UDP-N-acetylmuramoyl-tripeptide--D-alanyl-D-alanine ligase [Puniceicoccales bacterium]|jgi:UDP-N-acetylmuramoyl-tripeptide--D-alanyl-D-alanine ligase|nr:UDP-N-acetylmuramoyl-tripeptide--D-alanyl-D-alanine ligase [Puniceicoccales bacterium]